MGNTSRFLLSKGDDPMTIETIEKKFEVTGKIKLKLNNIRGSITISPGEDSLIEIIAEKHIETGSQDLTEIVIQQESESRVVVKTEFEKSWINWFGLNKPCKVDYLVRVPKTCELELRGVSCSSSINGISGLLDITSVSGTMELGNLSGSLKLNSVSGAIIGENLKGDLHANSVSGRIRLTQSALPSISAKSVSGSMVVETQLLDGPYAFNGVSGNVTVVIPEKTGCVANLKSVSGNFKTSLPITKKRKDGSKRYFELQGGGPELTYNSVSGSLRIVNDEGDKAIAQKLPVQESPQHINQLELLQKIDSGEITVDEALKKMKT